MSEGADVSVNELGSAGDQGAAKRTAPTRSPGTSAWLSTVVVRYRAMTLVPLLALAGIALAGLAGPLGLVESVSSYGSGCCPPK